MKIAPDSYLARATALGMPVESIKEIVHLRPIYHYTAVNEWLRTKHDLLVAVTDVRHGYQFLVTGKDTEYASQVIRNHGEAWQRGLLWAMSKVEAIMKVIP